MKLSLDREYFQVEVGPWFFTIWFTPRVWGFEHHKEETCCKFWLLAGPLELSRMWLDSDVYPFPMEDEDESKHPTQ